MVALGADLAAGNERRGARSEARASAASHLGFAVVQPGAATGLLPEWASLANRAAGDNAFFHPDFALPAAARLGKGVTIATVVAPDGRLAALAPFIAIRLGRIAPAVRLWSHNYGPLGLPLVDRSQAEAAIAALVEGLAPSAFRKSLIVPDLPLDGPVAAALLSVAQGQGRPVDVLGGYLRAVLDRPAGGLDVRAALPARRRKEYGRQMRRLADHGTVAIAATSEPGRVIAGFETFMALEAAGWKGRRGTALISSPAVAAFARDAVRGRAAAGAARIDAITLDARPIAMVVSFIAGATAFTWKIAYDEAYAPFSPGAQLMLDVATGLFADPAVRRIDSCADANHPMIDHLWAGRIPVGTLAIGPPGGGVVHRLGLAAARAEFAARAFVRRVRR